MPATEQTWRNQTTLHFIFGVSGLAMLLSTLWMFGADHDRQWKVFQKNARHMDLVLTDWRKQQQETADFLLTENRLRQEYMQARSQPMDMQQINAFKEAVQGDYRRRDLQAPEFDPLDRLVETANTAAGEAERMRRNVGDLQIKMDKARVGLEEAQARLDAAQAAVQAAETAVKAAQAKTDAATAPEEKNAAQEALNTAQAELQMAQTNVTAQQTEVANFQAQLTEVEQNLPAAKIDRDAAEAAAVDPRLDVIAELESYVADAKFEEDLQLQRRKFKAAVYDAERAEYDLGIRDNVPPEELEARQKEVNTLVQELEVLTLKYQAAAAYRKQLQKIVDNLRLNAEEAKKKLDDHLAERERLNTAMSERRSSFFVGILPGKRWLELPILDAFNSPLKIDNLWSEGLEQYLNQSGWQRRYDRCTTCHQNIQKTLPGTSTDRAFDDERIVKLQLKSQKEAADSAPGSGTIAAAPEAYDKNGDGRVMVDDLPDSLQLQFARLDRDQDEELDEDELQVLQFEQHFGLRLADEGLLSPFDVTVSFVQPQSLASSAEPAIGEVPLHDAQSLPAMVLQPEGLIDTTEVKPGLMVGDVIESINGDRVRSVERARSRLLRAVDSGETLELTIRRGLPHPYASHPRLDLYLTSVSPHKLADFACTICHEGQGSATDFKWASHTPDDPKQRREWSREYGWFDNHHWVYPMYSKRFLESTCLKCHHEVTELEPSPRFPDPPAAKLMQGHQLILKYGCWGCHEINGYDGKKRVGPDLRAEPNFFAAAQQLRSDGSFQVMTAEEQDLVQTLIDHPERDDVRAQLVQLLTEDESADAQRFTEFARTVVAPLLKDVESPGELRRVGPSLRFVGSKLDPAFLYDWIHDPTHFRPDTRMPQFFGQWDHLKGSPGLDTAQKFEPIEILGAVQFLLERSQPFEYSERPTGISEWTVQDRIDRGKTAFEQRGCLACHSHKDFPDVAAFRPSDKIQQGPDLSQMAEKLDPDRNPRGRDWMYSWIREPNRYHARTVMPDLYLEPITHTDAMGKVTVSDPAEDIVEYLMSTQGEWTPAEGTLVGVTDEVRPALDELVLEHLKDAFYVSDAERFLKHGIPEDMSGELKGAEKELLVTREQFDAAEPLSENLKLVYIGRKTIAKYGCYACHDIPGFEDAKPIGTGLADWGRKDPARLAFEHIGHLIEHEHEHAAEHGPGHDHEKAHGDEEAHDAAHDHDEAHDALPPFYEEHLMSGDRIGFLYQKLRAPRSYDYRKTVNKKYNERLRMPKFNFTVEEREAVMTFVLGLVAEPPSAKYLYKPDPRQEAIVEGQKVLEKYNCGGCHMLEAERWDIAYRPGTFGAQPVSEPTFPFVLHQPSQQTLQQASQLDRRELLTARLEGIPAIGNDGLPIVTEAGGEPLYEEDLYTARNVDFGFMLLSPTILDGNVYQVDNTNVLVRGAQIEKRYASVGGDLTKYLLPRVVAHEQILLPTLKGSEAWGWLPPPLMGEGLKVQSEWLHNFLLDPHMIRPGVVLRMPKFNMSSEEATKLVNYFAARDDAEYPYTYSPRRRSDHLQKANAEYQAHLENEAPDAVGTRLEHALRVVTNGNYCVQCHIVADFVPTKEQRGKGPDLADVYKRLRPEYTRQWLAKPWSILPYTGMPVNFKYDATKPYTGTLVPQNLYHGDSVDQLDAVLDLIMNFDTFAAEQTRVTPLVKEQQLQQQQDQPETPATGGNTTTDTGN